MKNLKFVINNIFKVKNVILTLLILILAWSLRYMFLYFFGVPLPNLLEEPLHLYRLIYLLILKGASVILNKALKKFTLM